MSRFKTWISGAVYLLALGVIGAWLMPGVLAQEHHPMEENESPRTEMSHPSDRGGMDMPMMRPGMSEEEMDQYCDRIQKRHATMQKMRRRNTERLRNLVSTMEQAEGPEKIDAMESVLVELVEQHNRRGSMKRGSMHAMMGSMMNMQRMEPERRRMMMRRMQDCPMMESRGHDTSSGEMHAEGGAHGNS